jgi:hypothetical protein
MRAALLRTVELRLAGSGSVTFTLLTDMPGGAMASRHSQALALTADERAHRVDLPGTVRGKLMRFQLSGAGSGRLEGLRVYMRALDPVQAFDWAWRDIPVETTALGYSTAAFPVESTGYAYSIADFPVERTALGYSTVSFPVEPTAPSYSTADFPVERTAPGYQDVQVPLMGPPVEPVWVELPIDR